MCCSVVENRPLGIIMNPVALRETVGENKVIRMHQTNTSMCSRRQKRPLQFLMIPVALAGIEGVNFSSMMNTVAPTETVGVI